jgi:hypothetical protein
MNELDVAPGFHMRHDRLDCVGIVLTHEIESALGEDHAEAESGVGGVLLEELDLIARVTRLPQISEVESGRAAAEDCDAHQ